MLQCCQRIRLVVALYFDTVIGFQLSYSPEELKEFHSNFA